MDSIFRRLAIEYLPTDKRHELNIYTLEERNAALDAGSCHACQSCGTTSGCS